MKCPTCECNVDHQNEMVFRLATACETSPGEILAVLSRSRPDVKSWEKAEFNSVMQWLPQELKFYRTRKP